MPKKEVAAFLVKLSKDAKFRARFRKDPDGVMDGAGLSAAEKKTLRSGDPAKIRKLTGEVSAMMIFLFGSGDD